MILTVGVGDDCGSSNGGSGGDCGNSASNVSDRDDCGVGGNSGSAEDYGS